MPFVSLFRDQDSDQSWRKYEDYTGARIFYDGFVEHVKEQVLGHPKVLDAIAQAVHSDVGARKGKTPSKSRLKRKRTREARQIVDGMVARTESHSFIKWAAWMVEALLNRTYHQGIFAHTEDISYLQATAKEAERKRIPLLFLPCHRSHTDYVALQLIFYRLGISLPAVIAGENLNFALVGSFLANAGAFFIRRSFGDSSIYYACCSAYLEVLLLNGQNIEWYIEGERSRTGKMMVPKFGMLKMVVSIVQQNNDIPDAWIIPVSIGYDRVLEAESYVSELLGREHKPESLWATMKNSRAINLKLGSIEARFASKISVREYLQLSVEKHNSPVSIVPLRTLAYEINKVTVIMPTALVGTVLLTIRGRGISEQTLIRRVGLLRDYLHSSGSALAPFDTKDTERVVHRALDVMGHMIQSESGLLDKTYTPLDRFQLSLYRNQVIHIFLPESLICVALYSEIRKQDPVTPRMTLHLLHDHTRFLSKIFQKEFIYPIGDLDENIINTLQSLVERDILKVSDGTVALSATEESKHRENFEIYCNLMWPFLDAYYLATVSMCMLGFVLPRNRWTSLRSFVETTQLLGRTLYHQGYLYYIEAISRETLVNAVDWYIANGVLESNGALARRNTCIRLAGEVAFGATSVQSGIDSSSTLGQIIKGLDASRRTSYAISHHILELVRQASTALTESNRTALHLPLTRATKANHDPRSKL